MFESTDQSVSRDMLPVLYRRIYTNSALTDDEVRQIVIGTLQENGAIIFWETMLSYRPYLEIDTVSWKFCYILHSMLRDGHPNCIRDSLQYKAKMENICEYWNTNDAGEFYGIVSHLYYIVLKAKLNFHEKNPYFLGKLVIMETVNGIVGDCDFFFQLLEDIFVYMDCVLVLQSMIFTRRYIAQVKQMNVEQFLIPPLVPLFEELNQLYKHSEKVLFFLHGVVAPDVFDVYQTRFLELFNQIKEVSQKAYTLWDPKVLVSIPSLPENPPNFSNQAETTTQPKPELILLVETNSRETCIQAIENTNVTEG